MRRAGPRSSLCLRTPRGGAASDRRVRRSPRGPRPHPRRRVLGGGPGAASGARLRPQTARRCRLLEGRLLAAHAVHLSAHDIRLLADHGAGIAHCPGSNATLASGIAALTALRAASVAGGLGTDGPASNDDLDLWEEMRRAMMLARATTADPLALTAKSTLLLATRGAADAVGRQDIGTLSPGTWAGMIHVGVDVPHFAAGLDVPEEQLLADLVWAAGSRAVRDVWVAGEQVVADGEPLRVGRLAAQREVALAAAHILRAERQE
ncbi:amidohydrolase family protein [Streptomyces sp. NPDC052721]|uniref:amidohydrolase family protein n=1 Tax=Streptomyces sp. NPDC052721 TaxID=3154955 RepID=UPI00342CC082